MKQTWKLGAVRLTFQCLGITIKTLNTSPTASVATDDPMTTRPDQSALRAAVARHEWFHTIDLGDGIVTPGRDRSDEKLARLRLPERLDGRSVLDVGAWDGFFSFAAERRGAKNVLATDSWAWRHMGGRACFDLAHRALDSAAAAREIDVMELTPEDPGAFDVVLFLGVLYHLRHPLLALERIASVTRELLVLETHVDMLFARRPAIALYPGNELNQDPSNFSGPNPPALIAMLRIVGFKRAEVVWRDSIARRLGRAARNLLRTGADPWASLQQGRVVVHAWK